MVSGYLMMIDSCSRDHFLSHLGLGVLSTLSSFYLAALLFLPILSAEKNLYLVP
jgi:hypothetical protein